MRNFLILLALLVGVALAAFAVFKLNPRTSPREKINRSFEVDSGFTVLDAKSLSIYADLDTENPRVLAFDPRGVLIASLTSGGKVVALPDTDGNGKADSPVTILSGLNRPHGLAFNQNFIYVAETERVVRYVYDPTSFSATSREVLFSLPGGGRHFTRTIKVQGDKLYTSVGSSCDVCVEKDPKRASILVSNLDGSDLKVYATGLRNTVFFVFDERGRMWGTDMGRDNLGDSLPPDELNIISEGKNYGWPYCFGDKTTDTKFKPDSASFCDSTEVPLFNFPAHVAPLGLTFDSQGNLLVAYHGSWNSSVPVGYKVVRLKLLGDTVMESQDFVTGFLQNGEVLGRPADLIFDQAGNLYISDDKAGLIYKVAK